MVTWGINPGQVVSVDEEIPSLETMADETAKKAARKAFNHMEVEPGETMVGYDVDVAFLGTCTNGRFSDFKEAARVIDGKQIDEDVHGLAVPGSETVRKQCEAAGLDDIFREAGFEWRQAGCSMCLAMNNDSLEAGEVCASSSNRNFIGRQGDKEGRTVLMSPAMVAAAAIEGEITDVREHELTAIDAETNPTAVIKGDY